MGSAWFLSPLPVFRQWSRDHSHDPPPQTEIYAVLPFVSESCPQPKDCCQLSPQTEVPNRCSSSQAHPPFEAFPSDLAVPSSPPQSRVATPLDATVWPIPLVVASCVFPPRSLGFVAKSGVPQSPGQSLNLRDLSQARVRCTHKPFPTCPCPLLPWAFRASVHRHPGNVRLCPFVRTKTRPDAPTSLLGCNPKAADPT